MPVRPPAHLFRVELIDVVQVARALEPEKEPVIKYVEREVIKVEEKIVYKDDPRLLEQHNKVLKENGELKRLLEKMPTFVDAAYKDVSPQIIEVEKQVMVTNKQRELIVAALSFIVGIILCYLILKYSYQPLAR